MSFDANKINTFLCSVGYQVGDQVSVRCLPAKTPKGVDRRSIPNLQRHHNGVPIYGSHVTQVGGDWKRFQEYNRLGFAIYLVVNPGGEKDSDITTTRVMFWECDTVSIEEQKQRAKDFEAATGIEICAAVQTRSSVHFYIPVAYGDRLEDWIAGQKRLIQAMDSDRAIWNPARLMRLPEFDHTTWDGNDFLRTPVRLLRSRPYEAANPDALELWLPDIDLGQWKTGDGSAGEIEAVIGEMNPFDIRNFAPYLEGYNPTGRVGWITCKCPAHNGESDNSLHINQETGRYTCHAGCNSKAVWKAAKEVAEDAGWKFSDQVKELIQSDWDGVKAQFGSVVGRTQALYSWAKMLNENTLVRSLVHPNEDPLNRTAIKDIYGPKLRKQWEEHAVTLVGRTWQPGQPRVVELEKGGKLNVHEPYRTGQDGDVTPWLDHVKWILPYDWKTMLNFLAFTVRQPQVKINWGIFWVGKAEGTGKDLLLTPMRYIMSREYKTVDAGQLDPASAFNSYLANAKLLHLSEIRDVNGSRVQLVEHLKAQMASSGEDANDFVWINEKNQRPYRQQNITNFIFVSNHADALSVKGARRWVTMMSPRLPRDPDYYTRLANWLGRQESKDAIAHFLHYEWDLSGFNPKSKPGDSESANLVELESLREDDIAIQDAMEECGGVIELSAMLNMLKQTDRGYKNSWLKTKLQRMGYVVANREQRRKIDGQTKRIIAYDPEQLSHYPEIVGVTQFDRAYEIAKTYYKEHQYLPGSTESNLSDDFS